jgi:hypothetical protein
VTLSSELVDFDDLGGDFVGVMPDVGVEGVIDVVVGEVEIWIVLLSVHGWLRYCSQYVLRSHT